MGLLAKAMSRLDGWINLVTGVGQGRTQFDFSQDLLPDDQTLENLYHGDPFASRICRLIPSEALRQGYRLNMGDPEIESRVQAKLDSLLCDKRLIQAWTWGRVFGGGAVFIGADDGQDPALPLDELALQDIHFLVALDKRELIPTRWYRNPLDPKFGEVEIYRFARAGGVGVDTREVHETRLLRFEGVITTRRRKIMLQGWGESELVRVLNVLQQFSGNYAAVSTLVQDSSQGVFGIKGFFEMMASDSQDALRKRLELMDLSRSVAKAIMVDAEEETYEKVETGALTGLADVLDKFALYLAGAAEMPVSLLLGQAPAGLNATGDSDIRWFYDRIRSDQNFILRPNMERLVRLVMRCDKGPTQGLEPVKWSIEFNPLWQQPAKDEAETRKLVAETDASYITSGVYSLEEVACNRFRPEGWSAETSLDLTARKALLAASQVPSTDKAQAPADTVLNGAQIASLVQIATAVVEGTLPRDTAIGIISVSFPLTPDQASAMLGTAGGTPPPPPAPPPPLAAEAEKNLEAQSAPTPIDAAPTVEMKAPTESTEPGDTQVGDPTEGGIKAQPLPQPVATSTIYTPPSPTGGPQPGK